MLIFGHELLQTYDFYRLKTPFKFKEDRINCYFYDENFIKQAQQKEIKFAIFAKNENEVLLSNALGASFILFEDEILIKAASKMAEFYLFDSKILWLVKDFEDLTKAYELGADGVILRNFIQGFDN